MRTVDPDGRIVEWVPAEHDWMLADGTVIRMSRPKDQDQDEPATPPSTQTRTLAWTGYQLTVKELRSWLDQIPNHAVVQIKFHGNLHGEPIITATWEIPS